jgi:hypothetical protein
MRILAVGVSTFLILCLGIYISTNLTSGQTGQVKDEPTLVQPGQATEKQKEFSKVYKKLYSEFKGRKLSVAGERGRIKGGEGEVGVTIGSPNIPTFGPEKSFTPTGVLTSLSCRADAIVRGHPSRKTANLTDDETFVYTEYDFLVKEVIKNTGRSIDTDVIIQVTRPGGLIKLNDQVIRVEDKSYRALETDAEYVLFLKYVPTANGFIVADATGDFRLDGSSFTSHSTRALPKELRSGNREELLNLVREATRAGCASVTVGGQ